MGQEPFIRSLWWDGDWEKSTKVCWWYQDFQCDIFFRKDLEINSTSMSWYYNEDQRKSKGAQHIPHLSPSVPKESINLDSWSREWWVFQENNQDDFLRRFHGRLKSLHWTFDQGIQGCSKRRQIAIPRPNAWSYCLTLQACVLDKTTLKENRSYFCKTTRWACQGTTTPQERTTIAKTKRRD